MKNIFKNKFVVIGGVVLLVLGVAAFNYDTLNSNLFGGRINFLGSKTLIDPKVTETVSAEEIAGLQMMREEEKVAHDLYVTFEENWKQGTFTSIAISEQYHTDAVKSVLLKYKLSDPAQNQVGKFTSKKMQDLFNDRSEKAKGSYLDSLFVAAEFEELDVVDLRELAAESKNKDVITLYKNLEAGSRNHMRYYAKLIAQEGATYTAKHLEESDYQKIIKGAAEKNKIDNK